MTLDLITKQDLQLFKDELFAELRNSSLIHQNNIPGKKWLKSNEVRKMLNISSGTLQNLRVYGHLPFTKIGSLMYYKLEDIERVLEEGLTKRK